MGGYLDLCHCSAVWNIFYWVVCQDPLHLESTTTDVTLHQVISVHDDVIEWNHFPRYWPFVRGIHRSSVNSAHKGQWRGALMFSLICAWINAWVNTREAGDLRRHLAHYDVTATYGLIIRSRLGHCEIPCETVISCVVRVDSAHMLLEGYTPWVLWSCSDLFDRPDGAFSLPLSSTCNVIPQLDMINDAFSSWRNFKNFIQGLPR